MSPSASNLPDTLLVESIRLDPEGPVNLVYHQARLDRSMAHFFRSPRVDLEMLLRDLPRPSRGTRYKVRVVYGREVREVTVRPYAVRDLKRVRIVHDDSIDYRYKYLDRSGLDELKRSAVPPERTESEDILIIKNGLLTDTTFSNVALFDGHEWVTPDSVLLPGTRRARLIDEGKVRPVRIGCGDLTKYSRISFINAMLDLGELVLSMGSVLPPGSDKTHP
ncbi:MAG: aminotransferase class IV [Spirochaetia bacterium]